MDRASTLGDQAKHILGEVETTLGWWFGELANWFDSVVNLFGPMIGRTRLVARMSGAEIDIQEIRSDGPVAIDKLTRQGTRSPTAPLKQGDKVSGSVEFFLDQSDVLSGDVELPSAAASNIRQALAFQLPRLLPLESNDILFGASIIANDVARERMTVGYAVARKDSIERMCKALESNGYRASKIFATPVIAGSKRQIELERAGQGRLLSLPFLSHPLTGLAAAGGALLLAFAIGQLRDSQISAAADQSEVARLEAGTAISLAQRAAELRSTVEEIATLRKSPVTAALLSDLAANTPDDAWFDRLTISGSEVRISGYGLTAASVLSELGHSTFLTNISFATPVVVDAGTGKERFDIRADLAGAAPPPEAQP